MPPDFSLTTVRESESDPDGRLRQAENQRPFAFAS